VINRFVIQSVLGLPLMVYGNGSQVRGIIEIRDTVRCLQLACENPADPGEFRVFNQMTQSLSITQMAEPIARVSPEKVTIEHLANPRVEEEGHHYNVVHSGLVELGLEPHLLSDTLIESLFGITKRFAHRVRPESMVPTINWRRSASQISL
jgi:UDP-sulfoquinovose synthase